MRRRPKKEERRFPLGLLGHMLYAMQVFVALKRLIEEGRMKSSRGSDEQRDSILSTSGTGRGAKW